MATGVLMLIAAAGCSSGSTPQGQATAATSRRDCSTVVGGTTSAKAAVAKAGRGEVVCLADGSYGSVALRSSARVTLRAQHAGRAELGPVRLAGRGLTLARFIVHGEITVAPGSSEIAIRHNRISGGYFGVDAGPTTSTTVNDVAIVGNRFVGPFGEDGIRLNRYHDANGDGIGALVEDNEFTGIRENGNHSDCLQTVWVGDHLVFRANYLHDNRCQGFFVKDQASPIIGIRVEDNLFLRNTQPCAPTARGCGQPVYFHVFGPYSRLQMRRNTIWGGGLTAIAAFREASGGRVKIERNVVYRFWTDTDLSGGVYRENLRCRRETSSGGRWPSAVRGERVDCTPSFVAPRRDDFRLPRASFGVDWRPAARHFGP